jgi:hypothetical protein
LLFEPVTKKPLPALHRERLNDSKLLNYEDPFHITKKAIPHGKKMNKSHNSLTK